jgi:arachidonate 15-lipoxygenase
MPVIASLPSPADAEKRKAYFEKIRKQYAYQYSYNETFATVIKVPEAESAGCAYQFAMLKNLSSIIPSLPRLLWTQIKQWLQRPITGYQEYLFFGLKSFPDTRFIENFQSDEYFGLQRVIGINHVALHRATQENPLPTNLDLVRVKDRFSKVVSGVSFDEALKTGRLYYVDYHMLQGLVDHPGEYKGRKQYVTAPILLLYRQDTGVLQPVAIQLNQQKAAADNPVFMPMDGLAWVAAKLYAQVADVNYQEFISHATRIHYLMESFIIATHWELYKTHPIFVLLKPHLRYTLSVNAHDLFLKNKKGVPGDFGAQLAGDYDSMVALMSEAFKTYDFQAAALPVDLKARHLDENPELFYPYAEEGRKIWEMTQKFVRDYVNLYYVDDAAVSADVEVQAWARKMSAHEDGMRIKNFPSSFSTREALAQAVGQIIFTASAHHSSVHYPQYLFSGFTPAMPFAAYAPPPTSLGCNLLTEKYLLDALPLRQPSMTQALIFYLTNFRMQLLGQDNLEPKAQPIIETYRQELKQLSEELNTAMPRRAYPYVYLNPETIPNTVMV